jgi:preprotein translocase subunit SecG
MTFVLDVVQVFISVMLVFLILMHSGKDSGLSGFGMGGGTGGGGGGPFSGGSLVERNLNRWTILFAVLLPVNTIILAKVS